MNNASFTPNIFDAPDDEIICWCTMVTKGQVCKAIADGFTTLDALHERLGILRGKQCAEKSPRGRCCCQEVVAMLTQSALCRARHADK
jgi:NAD(P)H-nitrite reductase large subunit